MNLKDLKAPNGAAEFARLIWALDRQNSSDFDAAKYAGPDPMTPEGMEAHSEWWEQVYRKPRRELRERTLGWLRENTPEIEDGRIDVWPDDPVAAVMVLWRLLLEQWEDTFCLDPDHAVKHDPAYGRNWYLSAEGHGDYWAVMMSFEGGEIGDIKCAAIRSDHWFTEAYHSFDLRFIDERVMAGGIPLVPPLDSGQREFVIERIVRGTVEALEEDELMDHISQLMRLGFDGLEERSDEALIETWRNFVEEFGDPGVDADDEN